MRHTITVEELAQRWGIGRAAAYAAARSGLVPALRVGRRLIVPLAALERLEAEGGPRPGQEERA